MNVINVINNVIEKASSRLNSVPLPVQHGMGAIGIISVGAASIFVIHSLTKEDPYQRDKSRYKSDMDALRLMHNGDEISALNHMKKDQAQKTANDSIYFVQKENKTYADTLAMLNSFKERDRVNRYVDRAKREEEKQNARTKQELKSYMQ